MSEQQSECGFTSKRSTHPRQHVPRGACPTTPTERAFDVYNSTPSDFKPPIPRSNPAEACPCPASACSRLAIDFLAHRPRQEQALFNGLLIGREAEEGCAEAQLTRGQASCLLCLPPPSVFFLPECNGVGKALGLVLWPGLSATRDLLLTHRMTWDKASSAARWEEIVLGWRVRGNLMFRWFLVVWWKGGYFVCVFLNWKILFQLRNLNK